MECNWNILTPQRIHSEQWYTENVWGFPCNRKQNPRWFLQGRITAKGSQRKLLDLPALRKIMNTFTLRKQKIIASLRWRKRNLMLSRWGLYPRNSYRLRRQRYHLLAAAIRRKCWSHRACIDTRGNKNETWNYLQKNTGCFEASRICHEPIPFLSWGRW